MPTIQIPAGANLTALASQYKTDVPTLLKLNPGITNPDFIKSGSALNIPDTGVPGIPSSQTTTPTSEKTFDGAGTPPIKTLPDTSPKTTNPLIRFASVLNDAVSLAKAKRAKLTEATYNSAVPMGALPATSFAGFLNADISNSTDFTKPLVETATSAFKTDEKTLADNKDTIRGIAKNAAEGGASAAQVQKILGFTDVEGALIYATPLLKKKEAGSGDGATFSPDDKRTLNQAGLGNSPEAVKRFYLNAGAAFQSEFARNYAKGANQNVNIENIGYSYDNWVAAEEAKKKSKGDIASQIDQLDLGN